MYQSASAFWSTTSSERHWAYSVPFQAVARMLKPASHDRRASHSLLLFQHPLQVSCCPSDSTKMGRFQLNVCCLAILCLPLALCGPLGVQFRKHKAIYRESIPGTTTDSDPGQPLFLTPYIEKGEIDQGKVLQVSSAAHNGIKSERKPLSFYL